MSRIFVKIFKMTATSVAQTYEEIKALYPDEWVLIGDLELKEPMLQTSISRNFKSGVVLLHGTDRFDIARRAKDVRIGHANITLIFTGNIPQNRPLWLKIHTISS
jgi:hypothetical protein